MYSRPSTGSPISKARLNRHTSAPARTRRASILLSPGREAPSTRCQRNRTISRLPVQLPRPAKRRCFPRKGLRRRKLLMRRRRLPRPTRRARS